MEVSDTDVPATTTKKRKICDGDVKLNSPSLLRFTSENYASSESAGSSTSCCCSVDLDENGVEVAENKETRSSKERPAKSEEMESTKMPENENSQSRTPERGPSADEVEEFFTRCEKELFKRFREKYNFDIEKEEPLEGRYEWVQI